MTRAVVVAYDPRWPPEFDRAFVEIASALGEALMELHHIGSTSIPNMWAKPVIDMLAVVRDLQEVDRRSGEMEEIEYEVMGEFGIAGRRYFRRDDSRGVRTHQVHAFERGSEHATRHLAFRDYLQAHADVAREYAELKRRLACDCESMEAYMDGKDGFIKDVERRAVEWWDRKNPGRR